MVIALTKRDQVCWEEVRGRSRGRDQHQSHSTAWWREWGVETGREGWVGGWSTEKVNSSIEEQYQRSSRLATNTSWCSRRQMVVTLVKRNQVCREEGKERRRRKGWGRDQHKDISEAWWR